MTAPPGRPWHSASPQSCAHITDSSSADALFTVGLAATAPGNADELKRFCI